MSDDHHEYSKSGVTVVWTPSLCIHSAKCVLGLGSVFNPQARPWVNMDGAPAKRRRCGSALLERCRCASPDFKRVFAAVGFVDKGLWARQDRSASQVRTAVPKWRNWQTR
jgi:uncharacterized Fe-S cluster protein YjdI